MANEEPLLGDGTKYEAMQSDDSEDTDDERVRCNHHCHATSLLPLRNHVPRRQPTPD